METVICRIQTLVMASALLAGFGLSAPRAFAQESVCRPPLPPTIEVGPGTTYRIVTVGGGENTLRVFAVRIGDAERAKMLNPSNDEVCRVLDQDGTFVADNALTLTGVPSIGSHAFARAVPGDVTLVCAVSCTNCTGTQLPDGIDPALVYTGRAVEPYSVFMPFIAITTVPHDQNYTTLCPREWLHCGATPWECAIGPSSLDEQLWYRTDRDYLASLLTDPRFPLAAAALAGGVECFEGVEAAVIATGEPGPVDSFGQVPIVTYAVERRPNHETYSGDWLPQFKSTFAALYSKHRFPDNRGEAVLLVHITSTMTVGVFDQEQAVRSWLAADYPNITLHWTYSAGLTVDYSGNSAQYGWLGKLAGTYRELRRQFAP